MCEGQKAAGASTDVEEERPDHGTEGHDKDFRHGRAKEDPADEPLLGGVWRAVARVVVAALRPAQPAQSDREREASQIELPAGTVVHRVQLGMRDGETKK